VIDDAGAHPAPLLRRARDGERRRIVEVAQVPVAWGITVEPSLSRKRQPNPSFLSPTYSCGIRVARSPEAAID
jgi:hypothetical protein